MLRESCGLRVRSISADLEEAEGRRQARDARHGKRSRVRQRGKHGVGALGLEREVKEGGGGVGG